MVVGWVIFIVFFVFAPGEQIGLNAWVEWALLGLDPLFLELL